MKLTKTYLKKLIAEQLKEQEENQDKATQQDLKQKLMDLLKNERITNINGEEIGLAMRLLSLVEMLTTFNQVNSADFENKLLELEKIAKRLENPNNPTQNQED